MGSGGGGTQKSTTENTIAPELRPLFEQTSKTITGLQPDIAGQFGDFFGNKPQVIPGFTPEQSMLTNLQSGRAFGSPLSGYEQGAAGMAGGFGNANPFENYAANIAGGLGNLQAPEQAALNQIGQLDQVPFGQLPTTQSAIAAARTPALNELAMAGLGNSDAVGTSLAGAYAPIYAQEMAFRNSAIPQLTNLGAQLRSGQSAGANLLSNIGGAVRGGGEFGAGLLNQIGSTGMNRQSDLINQAFGSQEALRNVGAAQEQANTQDFLRRQGLGLNFTTGILSGFPAISGTSSIVKSTGGAGGK